MLLNFRYRILPKERVLLVDTCWQNCLDLIEDGIIAVNNKLVITVYNRRAREIFGIVSDAGVGHPAGKIAQGDIVVLADNSLGSDDGGLTPQDLQVIGLPPRAVNTGDAVIAVGRYMAPYETPYYKFAAGGNLQAPLTLKCCINKRDMVQASIDDFTKNISISVNDIEYKMGYQITIGHIVIIDGNTGKVKFYQARGCTARGEDAKQILLGREYSAKGPDSPAINLIGQPLEKIHPDNKWAYYLDLILKGKSEGFEDKEYLINGIWVRSSAYPLYDSEGKVKGGALVLRDINELKLLERQVQNTRFKYPAFQNIKGDSPAIMEAIRIAQRVSKSKSTVLLLGESGTGKSLFARAIHANSPRADKPLVTVNIAAIPGGLLESELFGYEEGAFTGAKKGGERGKFRLADGGTIFLDEIGEMDFYLQAKILHVLQDGTFYPVGSSRTETVDVRVIAATNKNLEDEVKKGKFREDLYYRLNVVSLTIPPLRQRRSDIRQLIEHLLPLIRERVGLKDIVLSPEVYEAFLSYDWPGNVRELENVLERAVNMAEGNTVTRTALPEHILFRGNGQEVQSTKAGRLKEYLAQVEKEAIVRALKEANNNKTLAMKRLGIGRTAFYEKIKGYRIPLRDTVR